MRELIKRISGWMMILVLIIPLFIVNPTETVEAKSTEEITKKYADIPGCTAKSKAYDAYKAIGGGNIYFSKEDNQEFVYLGYASKYRRPNSSKIYTSIAMRFTVCGANTDGSGKTDSVSVDFKKGGTYLKGSEEKKGDFVYGVYYLNYFKLMEAVEKADSKTAKKILEKNHFIINVHAVLVTEDLHNSKFVANGSCEEESLGVLKYKNKTYKMWDNAQRENLCSIFGYDRVKGFTQYIWNGNKMENPKIAIYMKSTDNLKGAAIVKETEPALHKKIILLIWMALIKSVVYQKKSKFQYITHRYNFITIF